MTAAALPAGLRSPELTQGTFLGFSAHSVRRTLCSFTRRVWLLWASGCDDAVSSDSTSKWTKKWFSFSGVAWPSGAAAAAAARLLV